jgi:hypothetical protein
MAAGWRWRRAGLLKKKPAAKQQALTRPFRICPGAVCFYFYLKNCEQKVKKTQRGGQKISGEQQRGRKLAAAGSQNHGSKRSKIRSGGQQRGRILAAAGGQNHGSRGAKKSAAGSSAAVNWQQQAAKIT